MNPRARRSVLTAYEHAHSVVTAAVARGDLVVPSTCEACGKVPGPPVPKRWHKTQERRRTASILLHHFDYLQPMEVIPLCWSCHRRIHLGLMVEPRTGRLYPQFISARKNHRAAGPALNADVVVYRAP